MAQLSSKFGTVVVGGGTGFIGGSLCRRLRQCGYDVVTVSRKPGPYRMSWSDVAGSGLPAATTAVVSLAGVNILDPWRRWTETFRQEVVASRVNTTRSLAAAAGGGGGGGGAVKVFVGMSGVGYYRPSATARYTELSGGGDFDFLSRLCSQWEAAAAAATEAQIRTVTVRTGVVLGRHGGMIQQLFWPFYFGVGGPVGCGSQYLPWIHIDDIVDLIVHAIRTPEVSGVLNGVAPEPITQCQFASAFAGALHRPAVLPLPAPLVRAMFGDERSVLLLQGQLVVPERTQASGFRYRYGTIGAACAELARRQYTPVQPF